MRKRCAKCKCKVPCTVEATVVLSDADWDLLMDTLNNPPPLNDKLLKEIQDFKEKEK